MGGATAVEFALVLPVFAALLMGTFHLCLILYADSALHFAVDDAARCASVKTLTCTNSASTIAYAQSVYSGPDISATFTTPTNSCGNQVIGTGTYNLNAVLVNIPVTVSATGCYPVLT